MTFSYKTEETHEIEKEEEKFQLYLTEPAKRRLLFWGIFFYFLNFKKKQQMFFAIYWPFFLQRNNPSA